MLPDLGVLYRDHAASVWRYARSCLPSDADAEDVTSDVFARAMRSTHTYVADRGSHRAWLMGIAQHAVADFWRRRKPEEPYEELPEEAAGDEALAAVMRADGVADLRRVLLQLSEREREALSLRFAGELPSAEIGDVLGISPTAARMLVHRAVTKLREVLVDG